MGALRSVGGDLIIRFDVSGSELLLQFNTDATKAADPGAQGALSQIYYTVHLPKDTDMDKVSWEQAPCETGVKVTLVRDNTPGMLVAECLATSGGNAYDALLRATHKGNTVTSSGSTNKTILANLTL